MREIATMSEFDKSSFVLEHSTALADKVTLSSTAIHLRALPEGHVLHILGRQYASELEERLSAFAQDARHAVRYASPGQWFVVGDKSLSDEEIKALAADLAADGSVVDQSHGRIRILIEGAAVEAVLAKGTAVDLALSAFPVGHSAATLIGHIGAHITRLRPTSFEIMVLRGFGESLWDNLKVMSAEYRAAFQS